jgi:ABC-type thiamine transport system substrate-binding protein
MEQGNNQRGSRRKIGKMRVERVEAWSIAAESPVAAPNGRAVRLWLVDIKRRGKIVRYWFKIQKKW